jgi:hypothetical protein
MCHMVLGCCEIADLHQNLILRALIYILYAIKERISKKFIIALILVRPLENKLLSRLRLVAIKKIVNKIGCTSLSVIDVVEVIRVTHIILVSNKLLRPMYGGVGIGPLPYISLIK